MSTRSIRCLGRVEFLDGFTRGVVDTVVVSSPIIVEGPIEVVSSPTIVEGPIEGPIEGNVEDKNEVDGSVEGKAVVEPQSCAPALMQ